VRAVWDPLQVELFVNQKEIEAKALENWTVDREKSKKILTDYCYDVQEEIVETAWGLSALLWTKYDEKF
jgi:hypothetical protein